MHKQKKSLPFLSQFEFDGYFGAYSRITRPLDLSYTVILPDGVTEQAVVSDLTGEGPFFFAVRSGDAYAGTPVAPTVGHFFSYIPIEFA